MTPGSVSVVIVNYNGARWLPRCLDSLCAQTYADLEIVLVDNASSDGSVAMVEDGYPAVRVVRSPTNIGFAAGNALGVEAARAALIMLINSDTWVTPTLVEDLVTEKAARGLDVIGPREADYETGVARPPYRSTIDRLGHPVYRPSTEADADAESFYLTGVCLLFTRSLFVETRGLDPGFFMYNEEVDWFWRLILLRKSFGYSRTAVVHHAVAGSSGTDLRPAIFRWRNENTLQMLLKNYSCRTLVFVLPIYLLSNIVEILGLAATGHADLARTYPQGWRFNVRHIRRIRAERGWVQSRRQLSDREVMSRMYRGWGKAHHLRQRALSSRWSG